MHDLALFRANLDAITRKEALQAEQNAAAKEIGNLKKQGSDTTDAQNKVREMKEQSAKLDQRVEELAAAYRDHLAHP